MLNQTGVIKKTYGNTKQILVAPELAFQVGIFVDDSIYVEEGGRKIVKAGTPMVGDLIKRDVVFTVLSTGKTPVGVLEFDVDVTYGAANGSLVVFGAVNIERLDEETKKMITNDVRAAMPLIMFISEP